MSTSVPATKSELQEFCLRKLGKGTININVDATQIEDRTQEALQYFYEYHFEGSQKVFISHQLTATTITFKAAATGTFQAGETVTGGTSAATGVVIDAPTTSSLRIKTLVGTFVTDELVTGGTSAATGTINAEHEITFSAPLSGGPFTVGETVTGGTSGATGIYVESLSSTTIKIKSKSTTAFSSGETVTGGTSSASGTFSSIATLAFFSKNDLDNKYITLTEDVISVLGIFDTGQLYGSNQFSDSFQFKVAQLNNFITGQSGLAGYWLAGAGQETYDQLLTGKQSFRYNRHMDRLYIEWDWANDAVVDKYIVVETWQKVDASTWADVFDDSWLKDYLTALLGEQWGSNLSKFGEIQLPGGITLNGETIENKYLEKRKELEEQVESKFSFPTDFLLG